MNKNITALRHEVTPGDGASSQSAGAPPGRDDRDGLIDLLVSLALEGVNVAVEAEVEAAVHPYRDRLEDADFNHFSSRARLKAMNEADAKGERLRTVVIEPESFDFDAIEPAPDYIVDRLIERGTVNIHSGDTGAAKSIHWEDAAVRFVKGEEWMGRSVPNPVRVLYVDEENPRRIVSSRLRALKMTNEYRDRLRYYRRQGIQFGAEKWTRWAEEECEDFRPDVLVIDTAAAATAVEVNDNDAVTALYTTVLRPLAERFNLAVVILHHERKPGAQETRNAGYAMMGARQWAGQADVHMTLTAKSEYTETPRDDGGVNTHKQFEFQVMKARDGHSSRPERTTVKGVKTPSPTKEGSWVLTSLEVEWGGRVEAETVKDDEERKILQQLGMDPTGKHTRKAVAEALGEKDPSQPGGSFKRAWTNLGPDHRALIEPDGKGVRLTQMGREEAGKLEPVI